MKKKTRRILLCSSVLIFLILGCLAVLFALGYKYDFVQNKFFKTGSFEVGTNIGAEVYINDELSGSTSFLGRAFSKGRLLPHTYNVRLQNEDSQPWRKLIDIEAGAFISFPRIVLISEELNEEAVASSSLSNITSIKFDSQKKAALVSNKRFLETISLENGQKELPVPLPKAAPSLAGAANRIKSPDGEKEVWLNKQEIWIGWLKDTGYQPYKKAGETELITRFSQKISDVQWYKDSAHLIADVGGVLKFIEIDTRGGLNVFDISTVDGPFYYDTDMGAVFKFEGNNLVRVGLK
jgi:hypothetical protein